MIPGYRIHAFTCVFLTVCSLGLAQAKTDTLRHIYEDVPQMPEFPGGIIAMERHLMKHLLLPTLKEAPPKAGVYTRFVVNTDGSVSDVKTARSCGNTAIDDSVKAVISRMPRWKPGMLDGKPVRCYYNLPISCLLIK